MIDSFEQDSTAEFNWHNLDFQYSIESNILQISTTGEYWGAYPSSADGDLFFDLSNGDILEENLVPFHTLFSLKGYFSFLKKYWLVGCKKEYDEAIKCANIEPYCNCYDINFSSSGNNLISFSLTNDCFPHVVQACSPSYAIDISLDSLKSYLSEFGKYTLFQKGYLEMSSIEKLIFFKEKHSRIPSFWFIAGSIDDQYPFSMALEFNDKTKKVDGYYFYNKKNKTIKLEGESDSVGMKLTESVDNKTTGRFEFEWTNSYMEDGLYSGNNRYCRAKWFDINNNELKIKLKDINPKNS